MLLALLSRRRKTWAFITGIVLYAFDSLLVLFSGSAVSLIVRVLAFLAHLIALTAMIGGLREHRTLLRLEREQAERPG